MNDEIYDYEVKCRRCHNKYTVQLFDSHERNLFVVDNKDWYCVKCKKDYYGQQTAKRAEVQKETGFAERKGSAKRISWAVKIRGELINKLNYLRSSLNFKTEDEKALSDKAFEKMISEWQQKTEAKWWIDNRKMTVRDIAIKIKEISESKKET
jgi:hypothetical protein